MIVKFFSKINGISLDGNNTKELLKFTSLREEYFLIVTFCIEKFKS